MINGKASVSKELNAKNSKVLEGLLKILENRECADCRTKGPRWASINLGIFICMQCSGIHRSLGVHISQVRSITLDTWLPEQVALMQSVGNVKSNEFWEAQLPSDYERREIGAFIRAKYVDGRWASKTGINPVVTAAERSRRCNEHDDRGIKYSIPTRPKRFSLDEQAFDSYREKIVPTVLKIRTGSLDMDNELHVSYKMDASTNKAGRFGLFHNQHSDERAQSHVPPSWTTFDCK